MSHKRSKYPACEIKFEFNIINSCSSIISKVNVELFKNRTGSDCLKWETDKRTDRHHGSQYIINDFPSKELQHRNTPFSQSSLHNGCQPVSFCFHNLIVDLFEVYY